MHAEIIDIIKQPSLGSSPETVLSFRPFIEYLKDRKESVDCHKSHFFAYVIEQFEKYPELINGIDVNDVTKYKLQLQLVYSCLAPLIDNEDEHFWALCLPLRPVIFYSTNVFYDLLHNMLDGNLRSRLLEDEHVQMGYRKLLVTYSFILERCYNTSGFWDDDLIPSIEDRHTGLLKYYKQKLDHRFIKISVIKELPSLDMVLIKSTAHDKIEILQYLMKELPLDIFHVEGFSITSIEDVTASHVIEDIKSRLLNHSVINQQEDYTQFIHSLKTLAGSRDVEFGLLPVLQVNSKLVFKENACFNSFLIKVAKEENAVEMVYKSLLENYIKSPGLILFSNIVPKDGMKDPYLLMLAKHGVASCALVPVFFNKTLVGLLEVYSKKEELMAEDLLAPLEPAMPLLSQLLKNTIDEFNGEVDKVIKEKFTALQPSVQWKFNEVALKYIQSNDTATGKEETEDIIFENVYPLYGAVDIRNSTVERNAALRNDLKTQFSVLHRVLSKLKQSSGFGLLDEKIFLTQEWLDKISSEDEFNDLIKLNDFLENDIMPFLIEFTESNDDFASIAKEYFTAIDERTGVSHENRRQLEKSMSTVISSVNNYFDMLKDEIQQAYPSYFEKFRTDGVEYDIYIGQSITPHKPYSNIYLKNLRLLQVTSMAAIAKYTHSLLQQLPKQVETTQLIFIHSQPIDIRFRKDEKRFDVEGAYNIRYHIIKKRIDKVRIKATNERLTQPNKIALVYFSQKEADEYISYIRYLQGEKILADDLEQLELEELQGVSGLKALRVGVNVG